MRRIKAILILLLFIAMPGFSQSFDTTGNDAFITIFLRGYVGGDDQNVLAISGDPSSGVTSFYLYGTVPFSSPGTLRNPAQGWRNIYQYWLMSAKQNSYYDPEINSIQTAAYTSDIYTREIGDFTNGWAPDSQNTGLRAAQFSSGPDAGTMIRRQPLIGLAKTQWVYEKVSSDLAKEDDPDVAALAALFSSPTINRLLFFGPKFYDMLVVNETDNYDLVEIGRGGVFQVVHES